MIMLFRFIDLVVTITQSIILFVIVNRLCHTLRVKCGKYLLPAAFVVLAYFWTWMIVDGTYKMTIQIILIVTLSLVFYKGSVFNIIASALMGLMIPAACESFTLIGVGLFADTISVNVSGIIFASLPVYMICILVNIIAALLLHFLLRNFCYQLRKNDFIVVLLFEFVTFLFINNSIVHFLMGEYNETLDLIIMLLSTAFMLLFLYLKNNYYLQEQEQKDKIQIAQLQQQFAYYQEKLKDEEKVRSVYHDMKNHLLVLQRQINSPETAEMVEKLQSQVAMYEHTGNDILDIILKEKSEKAREKHIALSVTADLSEVDFIEPLDISTIFGNGLDNAIEASEKLPEEQRAILVKAGKMQNFFSILIENNCLQSSNNTKKRTTKSDDFLHGFGISNMRKAAEKYGGQLLTKCENEKFILKILIPIP